MAEQSSRRPSGSRRGRPSFLQSILASIQKVWLGFWYYLAAPMRWLSRRSRSATPSAAATTGRKLRYYLFLPFSLLGSAFLRAGQGIRWWYRSTRNGSSSAARSPSVSRASGEVPAGA